MVMLVVVINKYIMRKTVTTGQGGLNKSVSRGTQTSLGINAVSKKLLNWTKKKKVL